MRHQGFCPALGAYLVGSLAESQGFGLGEQVGHQHVVLAVDATACRAHRVQALAKTDEVARHQACALMQQLVERVLTVGTRLTPDNRRCLTDYGLAVAGGMLAVAFHGQLLQIGRETRQITLVGQHRLSAGAEKVVVPYGQQPHQGRHVAFDGGVTEVLVHGAHAGQQLAEVLRADGDHG